MDVLAVFLLSLILASLLYLCFVMTDISKTSKTIQDDIAFLRKGSRASQWKKD